MKKNIKNIELIEASNKYILKAQKIKNANQRIDDLQLDGKCVVQNPDGYCFTSDSVLLANFCKPKSNARLLEFCAGCGVISILIDAKNKIKSIDAVELQSSLFDLCKKNFEINDLIQAVVHNCDLSDFDKLYQGEQFDCVVCNPPYEKLQSSFLKLGEEKSIARAERWTTFEKIANATKKALKFGGTFFFLFKAERLAECFDILRKYDLEPKAIQFIHEKLSLSARLFMCKAILGGKSGLEILPPIIRNNEDGTESQQIKNIYNRKDLIN